MAGAGGNSGFQGAAGIDKVGGAPPYPLHTPLSRFGERGKNDLLLHRLLVHFLNIGPVHQALDESVGLGQGERLF